MVSKLLEPSCGPVEIITVKTSGDRGNRDQVGAFVKEIQDSLLEGEIDLALHCLKDLPTEPLASLMLAAYLTREDPSDAMLSRVPWQELPHGSVVGTGSLRRSAQLAAIRPDFRFKPLVGNIDTRMRKLLTGDYDAIVLAIAGLKRVGLFERWQDSEFGEAAVQVLDSSTMLPAPGQAVLVLECLETNRNAQAAASTLNHEPTKAEAIAERSFLSAFGGGCSVPVGALAKCSDGQCVLHGLVASPDGSRILRGSGSGHNAEQVGRHLAAELMAQGALDLFATTLAGAGGSEH